MTNTVDITVGYGFVCSTDDHPSPFVIGPFTDESEAMVWLSNIRNVITEDLRVFGGTTILYPFELTQVYTAIRAAAPDRVGQVLLGPGMFSDSDLRPEDLDG